MRAAARRPRGSAQKGMARPAREPLSECRAPRCRPIERAAAGCPISTSPISSPGPMLIMQRQAGGRPRRRARLTAPGVSVGLGWTARCRGRGGLLGSSSLSRLLARERGVRNRKPLTEERILAWADAFRARTGRWPSADSGPVPNAPEEKWRALNEALKYGRRGLRGGSTLTRLLNERRASQHLPPLSFAEILDWADRFHVRTGRWPTARSGPVAEAPGETSSATNSALKHGRRGLPSRWSLHRLLVEQRGASQDATWPALSVPEILRWADLYRDRHGKWPTLRSGVIPEAPGETWRRVHLALNSGRRGLRGRTTLMRLLRKKRGATYNASAAPLTALVILAWADAYYLRTGQWPKAVSGPIPESPGDSWSKVNYALQKGSRGLSGGTSLVRLIATRRDRRHTDSTRVLTIPEILAWADAFFERHGRWPVQDSGAIPGVIDQTWFSVSRALCDGRHGLPGGSSLRRLLVEHRGCPARIKRWELTIPQILAWAHAFQTRHGRWPDADSGPIPESTRDTWGSVSNALREGRRGLAGGSSLAHLRYQERPHDQGPP